MKKLLLAATLFVVGSLFFSAGVLFAWSTSTHSFPDVATDAWYYSDVMNMADWDVIRGNDDGTFAPERNVNRAELSAMWNRYEKHLEEKFALKGTATATAPTVTTTAQSSGGYATTDYVDQTALATLNMAGTMDQTTLKTALDYNNKTYGDALLYANNRALDVYKMAVDYVNELAGVTTTPAGYSGPTAEECAQLETAMRAQLGSGMDSYIQSQLANAGC